MNNAQSKLYNTSDKSVDKLLDIEESKERTNKHTLAIEQPVKMRILELLIPEIIFIT